MILRATLITCLALSAAAPALALDIPNPSRSDSRVRSVSYNEWDVVRVVGTLRTSVQVVFAQTEEIIDVGSGDTVAWEIVPRGNILYLKPREANPPTNLQIATMREDGTTRTYSFELIVRDGAITNNSKDVYFQIRFAYPTDEANRRELRPQTRKHGRRKRPPRQGWRTPWQPPVRRTGVIWSPDRMTSSRHKPTTMGR